MDASEDAEVLNGLADEGAMVSDTPPDAPPCDDPARLDALDSYGILDTAPEPVFDDITRLAARICGTPIAVINLIGADRQWFKSEVGLGIRETPVDRSICAKLLLQPGLTIVPDMRQDERFRNNPFVANPPHLRFYAGVLLTTVDGHALGTLCVLDHRTRDDLTPDQKDALVALARQVMGQMELRRALAEAEKARERARAMAEAERESEERLRFALDAANLVAWEWNLESGTSIRSASPVEMFGLGEGTPEAFFDLLHPEDRPRVQAAAEAARRGGAPYDIRFRVVGTAGTRWIWEKARFIPASDGRPDRLVGISTDITESRRAESVRRESEARLRLVADAVPALIAYIDAGLQYRFANLAHEDWFGLRREDIHGRHLSEILGEETFATRRDPLRAALGGTPVRFDATARHRDGTQRDLEVQYIPHMRGGKVDGFFVLSVDITERKRTEKALREHARVLEILNRVGATLAAETDPDRLIQAVVDAGMEVANAEFAVYFAHEDHAPHPDDWTMRAVSGLPGDHLPQVRGPLLGTLFVQPGGLHVADLLRDPRFRQDPRPFGIPVGPVAVRSLLAVPVVSRGGGILGGLVLGHGQPDRFGDAVLRLVSGITAKAAVAIDNVRLHQALRDSEEHLRLALESAKLGTWDFNPQTRTAFWSERAKTLFGLSADGEISHDTFLAGIHPEDRDRVSAMADRALDPSGSGEYEAEFRTIGMEDGVERWLSARGRAFFEGGRAVRFIGTTQEVTERKRAEMDREAALEQRTMLLRELHHRVKNSLQMVASLLRIQATQVQDPRVRDEFSKACDRIETIAEVHTRLYKTEDIGQLDFGDYLDGLCSRLSRSMLADHEAVEIVVDAQAQPLDVDRAIPLGLVATEIVTNAIKHAFPPGERGRIEVRFAREGDRLHLRIADTGRGLPEDIETAETGLGFRLIRMLVRQLGGTLVIERRGGAAFLIEIPA